MCRLCVYVIINKRSFDVFGSCFRTLAAIHASDFFFFTGNKSNKRGTLPGLVVTRNKSNKRGSLPGQSFQVGVVLK